MKALAVDFRSEHRPPRWAWIALGVLVLLAVLLFVLGELAARRLKQQEAELDSLRSQLAASASPPAVGSRKMPYDASAREFLEQATSQWPAMLRALESAEIEGVTPMSIDVSPAEHVMRVEVEFADYSTLLKYIDALNAGEPVPRWTLVQAQVSTRQPGTATAAPSIASLRADW